MSILNTEVSYFKRANVPDKNEVVNLQTFLRSQLHREAVERIRAIADKEQRSAAKLNTLPGITPHGVFSYRDAAHLVKHSGFIAGDIDFDQNPYSADSLKRAISKIQNVAYCGLSVSGRGVWFLVPITDPANHEAHYEALIEDFYNLPTPIILDPAVSGVQSFRFISFDPAPYFNHAATPYQNKVFRSPRVLDLSSAPKVQGNDAYKVEAILTQIESNGIDITDGYNRWFSLGCSFAAGFGEDGRYYFHRVSQFHPEYNQALTDRQYTHCVRCYENLIDMESNEASSLGLFFSIAKSYGLRYAKPLQEESTDRATRPQEAPQQQQQPDKGSEATDSGLNTLQGAKELIQSRPDKWECKAIEPYSEQADTAWKADKERAKRVADRNDRLSKNKREWQEYRDFEARLKARKAKKRTQQPAPAGA